MGADMGCANLKNAFLWCANLEGARLLETNLSDANLTFTNLSKVKWPTVDQLCSTTTRYQSTIEQDLLTKVEQQCPYLLEDRMRSKDIYL